MRGFFFGRRRVPLAGHRTVAYARHMRHMVFLVVVLTAAQALAADIYRRPDRGEGVEFSDQPDPAAERVILSEPIVIPTPGEPAPASESSPARTARKLHPAAAYTQLQVLAPADEATVHANDGTVAVQVLLIPPLQLALGHTLSLSIDGNQQPSADGQTSFILTEVPPGTHQLQATVSASDGSQLLASPISRFYLRRHNIKPAKIPPGAKPKPAG